MIYLLDSNAWILYMRQTDPVLIQKVQTISPPDIRLCSVVLGELYYGAFHSPAAHQARNLKLIAQLLQVFSSVPFDDGSAEAFGQI